MADDTKIKKKVTRGRKFATLAARMKYLYGNEAKTYSLRGNVYHQEGMNFDKRKWTDKICMVMFVLVFLTMCFISAWAFMYGQMHKVLNGNDATG